MIHHLSIAARDPRHVAEVLAEFMGGAATRFTPNPGSWFAYQHDEHGTGVEVYPAGTELRPAGPQGAGFQPISRSASRFLRNRSLRSQSAKAGSAIVASAGPAASM